MRQGTPGFNGKRLKQARDIYGLTVTSLAAMIGISKQAISQFEKSESGEKGASTPRPEVLDKISSSLNFPKNFFLQESYIANETPIHYRSLSAATKAARARAESKFLWLQEITHSLKQYVDLPTVNIPHFEAKDHTKISAEFIEDAATATRRYWGLGDGPILNVLNLLENNGAIVSRIDLEADTLDALSQWANYDSMPYIFLSSTKHSAARSRFDISHELAHLTIHANLNKNICYNPIDHSVIEKQAHRFASSFLLPARSFMNDLVSPTLDSFWALKEKWQVSIAAMIMRCHHLEIIDEEYERKLWMNYNRRGWSKQEPLDDRLPIEQPKLLRRSLELLVKENILSREDFISQLPYPTSALEEIINLPKNFLSKGDNIEYFPTLKRVQNRDATIPIDSKVINFPSRNN
jgi:Zn-dependent peptidase ImmA (M78 family)